MEQRINAVNKVIEPAKLITGGEENLANQKSQLNSVNLSCQLC
jgi:hypothetical protein